MESGHEITICTCAHYEPFVREYGLGYAYVNNDFIDFMHSPVARMGNSIAHAEEAEIVMKE